jgi:hypothetical protein
MFVKSIGLLLQLSCSVRAEIKVLVFQFEDFLV